MRPWVTTLFIVCIACALIEPVNSQKHTIFVSPVAKGSYNCTYSQPCALSAVAKQSEYNIYAMQCLL
jgi:hypothetical protein